MIKGSCLCGAVKFEILGTPSSLSYCHCSRCRKAAGVFSAVPIGNADDLTVISGQDHIKTAPLPVKTPSGLKLERKFCKACGTSLGDMKSGDMYVVAASALDDDPGIKPSLHIHTKSKPDWYEIDDNLQKFDGDYIAD